jgi:hypothetical protein
MKKTKQYKNPFVQDVIYDPTMKDYRNVISPKDAKAKKDIEESNLLEVIDEHEKKNGKITKPHPDYNSLNISSSISRSLCIKSLRKKVPAMLEL